MIHLDSYRSRPNTKEFEESYDKIRWYKLVFIKGKWTRDYEDVKKTQQIAKEANKVKG